MALIHVDFFSEVLGMSSQMEVILPQQTEGQIGIGHVEKQCDKEANDNWH